MHRPLLFRPSGQGAKLVELTEDGEIAGRRTISVRAGAAPLTIVASRSHRTPETDDFIGQVEAAEIVSVGSSLKFCLLACGEADIYPRFGRTMEWDTAAGDAVLRAAGGSHLDARRRAAAATASATRRTTATSPIRYFIARGNVPGHGG